MTKAFSFGAAMALLLLLAPNAQAGTNINQPRTVRQTVAPSGGVRFAKAIEDLPIMPGLEPEEENDVLFLFGPDRIAQTTLKGRVDIDSVYYFYKDTLPSLGWKQITMRLYEREGEQLHLDASSANNEGMTYVHFAVEPVNGRK